ncbi:MAG TPA: hypothetical protein VF545_14315 [Thermoleophilaceae bacterium]|jgi:hypothetical protein
MARKRKKDAAEEAVQETRESPVVDTGEIRFSVEDAQAVGDPAAASTNAEGAPPGSSETEAPGATETAATTTAEPAAPEAQPEPEPVALPPQPEQAWDRSWAGDSPADADRRGAEEAPGVGSALGPIAGAFVGSFVLAKVIGRFGGGDD